MSNHTVSQPEVLSALLTDIEATPKGNAAMHASPSESIYGHSQNTRKCWVASSSADDLTHVTTRRLQSTMLSEAFAVVTDLLEQVVTGGLSALSKQGLSHHYHMPNPTFGGFKYSSADHCAVQNLEYTTELGVSATAISELTVDAQSTDAAVSIPGEVRCRPSTAERLLDEQPNDHNPAVHPNP